MLGEKLINVWYLQAAALQRQERLFSTFSSSSIIRAAGDSEESPKIINNCLITD